MTAMAAGYSRTHRVLHWLTVALLAVQIPLGYLLEADDGGRGRGRGRGGDGGDGGGHGRGRGRGGDDGLELLDEPWVWVHVVLGLSILTVGVVRILVRRRTALPPWSPRLGPTARRLQGWTERLLLGLLIVVPLTGLPVLLGDDDLLPIHVTAQICLYATLAVHLGTVLVCRTWPRMVTGRAV